MQPSKLKILYYFLRLRYSRIFSSWRVSMIFKKKWLKNLQKSPFYRKIAKSEESFPIMNKASFMKHFDEINTVGIRKQEAFEVALQSEVSRDFSPEIRGIGVGLSSGTSGNKGIFLTTKKEKAIWVGAVLDRVIGFSFKKRNVAFFLRANNNLYESVKSSILSFTFFDIQQPIAEHMQKLIALKPDILVAQPSVLMEIARHFQEKKLVPSIPKIISVAEVLEDDQKALFEQVFRTRIAQVYQCTEGFLAHTCKAGKLHFNEDWLEIEKTYLDEGKKRFHPIITDYLRSSQPVVRYELNDIIHEGSCSCGLKSTVIEKIEGRSDDVFRFQTENGEVLIYPDFIRRAVINASDAVGNYAVHRIGNRKIALYLKVDNSKQLKNAFEIVKTALLELFHSYGLEKIEVVPLHYSPDFSKKFKRVHNAYTETL